VAGELFQLLIHGLDKLNLSAHDLRSTQSYRAVKFKLVSNRKVWV